MSVLHFSFLNFGYRLTPCQVPLPNMVDILTSHRRIIFIILLCT